MRHQKIFYTAVLCALLCILSLFKGIMLRGQSTPVVIKEPHNSTIYIPLNIKRGKIPDINKINSIYRSAAKKIPFLEFVDKSVYEAVSFSLPGSCGSADCAKKYSGLVPVQRIIYGDIERIESDYEKLMGKEGKDKYLLKLDTDVTLIVNISLFDAVEKKILTSFRMKTTEKKIFDTKRDFIEKIKPFYKEKIKEAVPVVIEQPSKKLTPQISAHAEFLYPVGQLSKLADYGAGLALLYGLDQFPVSRASLNIYIASVYMMPASDLIDYLICNKAGIKADYALYKGSFLSIAPGVAGGYMIHFIKSVYDSGMHRFYDPFVQAEISFKFQASGCTFLYITPAFLLFFEEKYKGHSASVCAGLTRLIGCHDRNQ